MAMRITDRRNRSTALLAAYLSILALGSAFAQPAADGETAIAEQTNTEPARQKLLVRTLGPDGEPMAGVNIHVSVWSDDPFRPPQDNYTDDHGQVEVELPGQLQILRVWVRAPGQVPLFTNWDFRRNPEVRVPRDVTYRLTKGTVIGGVVKDDQGRPVAGATVAVENNGRSRTRDGIGEPVPTRQLGTVMTDDDGRWQLDNVPAGDDVRVRFELSHPDYVNIEDGSELTPDQRPTVQSLRDQSAVIVMHQGVDVTGVVADPEGNPVVGATVARGDELSLQYPGHKTPTGEDGIYRFPNLSAGKIQLTVLAAGWSPQAVEVDAASGMPPVDFTLEPGETLRMRIVDGSGNPVPDVRVRVDEWDQFKSPGGIIGAHPLNEIASGQSDEKGIYEWTHAPEGSVKYMLGKAGYAATEATLSADGTVHTVVMHPVLVIAGKVTDAETGELIESFDVPQVHYFRPDFLYVNRSDAGRGESGRFRMEFSRTDIDHGVRIEAMGYRTQLFGPWKIGEAVEELDVRMEPAAPIRGVVVDADGRPVAEATVCLGTHTQHVDISNHNIGSFSDVFSRQTGPDGRFSFPAQYERYALIVIHDAGYAEVERKPDRQPGELKLRPWARVAGRLIQDGEPIAGELIYLRPLRPRFDPCPRISDSFTVETDAEGRFVFKRVPPVKSALQAYLSVWRESPLRSSQSVPLDLAPGEQRTVDLGGEGAMVTGRVQLTGDASRQIDLHYSLNYLLRMAPGVDPPDALAKVGFDWRDGWSQSWTSSEEGTTYQQTLHHYFVVLDSDGAFRVSGVSAGEYELAFKIYEPPVEGCLVYPVGTQVAKFRVDQADVENGTLDLGDVKIAATLGPKPGDPMPDLEFVTADGTNMRLSDFRGRPVLLDFWATWCGPCVAALPKVRNLYDQHAKDDGLVVLGMSVDADRDQARQFIDDRQLPWPQVLLGDWGDTPIPEQLGISSVPAYFLIDENGVLVERGFTLETILEKLSSPR